MSAIPAGQQSQEELAYERGSLESRVVQVVSWVAVVAGIILTGLLSVTPEVPLVRVLTNLMVAVLGVIGWVMQRFGRGRAAAMLLVWGVWLAVTLLAWRNDGLFAPSLLNYPAFIIMAGWLLGKRQTLVMICLISVVLMVLYLAAQGGWLPEASEVGSLQVMLAFLLITNGLATLLTLLSRSGYTKQIAEIRRYKDHLEEEVQQRTAELVLARDAAESANKAKSTFLASMSHELRTPLNAILGFSSLMRRDAALTPSQTTNLDIINRSGEHLLTLINDILDLAKIEAGKTQLNITALDLGSLVRDVTDMMEIRARAKGLQLLIDQSSRFPRYIHGDEARLRQILINLLGNAVKFTEQGGVTLRLGTRQNGTAHLIIEVEDSGQGISTEDQQHLFHPFMQFGKQAGDNKGTGLGLSITRQFVELMGGSISATSTIGKGSIFRVDLPLSEVKEPMLLAQTQTQTEQGEVTGLAPGQPLVRVLIVEDQLENQLLLTQLMQRIGFEVQVAPDGKQGLQLFQSWQPQLIFMDRRMPNMDGIEATKAIRQLPGGQGVKIVAVTASAFMEQRGEMLAAGMDDFVRKPYRFNEIYDSLTRQLGVRYTYAESPTVTATPLVALTPGMLAVLPQDLRDDLKKALESLDSERISSVLQRVQPIDATLYHALSGLVENYDYPSILTVLKTKSAETE